MEQFSEIMECKCGSKRFKVSVEQIISDNTSDGKDLIANYTVEKESIHRLTCAKCGRRLIESFLKKPITKEDWEEHWEGIIFDFIHSVESFMVIRESDFKDDTEEAYLRGITKGMWAIYNLVERLMVQDKLTKGRKTMYQLSYLHELKVVK